MDSTLKGRFPNLNQTKSKQLLSFYHDCMLRVFDNHASRKSEYLGNILLSTAKSGDVPKLCKALEKVDLTKVDFNLKEKNTEKTPLMIAAEHGHDQIIEILLSCGSDVTLRNAGGCTVLENASEKITELILDSVNSRQGAGQPLLCQAAWQGNATVVKKLLHLNPSLNVNSKNCEGLTPLLLVTRDLDLFDAIKLNIFTESYNPTEVVSLLLHRNADCTAVDKDGRSALHLTARNHGTNARNIISLLARKDSLNVDLRDSQDCSALHCASETGDPNVLLALIDNGADVNARGPLGRTPLHVTASRGDERTSMILVEHGANVLFIDDLGFTPVDVAKGRNVQLLLKQAWREHARTSPDFARIKSAPVVLPVKLDHLDSPDVTDLMINKDESGEPLKKAVKKSSKRLQSRSHSEEQTQPSTSSGLSKRIRSYSSGPSPRSRLDPIKRENPLSDEGRASPLTQKTIVGETTPSPANVGMSKTPQTEIVPRPTARVAVLNIDLKGHDLRIKQKSKSCSELPYTRYRVHKLSNPRASLEIEPLSNPRSLRGRSVSAVPFSSFDTLPGITSEDADDDGENELSPLPDTSPVPEIVITPSAEGPDLPPGDDCPSSPETDVLNKTFNLKEKPVFLFPNDTGTNTSREVQNSERGFFVDWKTLEIPLQKCARCREYFKPEDIKRGTSVCNLCYKDSIAKDTFWVPFGTDERKRKSGTRSVYPVDPSTKSGTQTAGLNELNLQPGTHSQNVDDRTICIDKETLNVLRRKNLSEGSLDSTKSKESERSPETQEYFSDTSYNHKTSASKSQDSKTSDVQVQTNNDEGEMNGFAPDSDCSKSSLVATQHSNERLVQASQNDHERKPEADEIPLVKTDSFSTKNNQDLCNNTEESTEKNTEKILCSSVAEIVCKNEDVSTESDVRSLGNALQTKHNVKTANIHSSIIKEFEECKKTLECLCTDMMCLEKKDIPDDVIGRLYNQSMTKKGVMQEGSDMGYSGATRMKKGQLGFQGEAVKVVDSKQEFLDESKKDVSIIQTMDSERSSGVEIDAKGLSGIEMDETSKININTIDHLGTEVVNSDVSSHQIVIVNPFPSPVPPKIPIVNVSSSCQCDRYASFAKNTGMGGKKKGRAKKGTGTSGQKTATNAQNTKKTVVKKDKSKQNTRVVSAGKKSKKKLKELPNANVKEISVIQTELKCDTNEENDAIPQSAIISAPVRETTFIKEKFTALSPIPESGSSVQDTASDVCLSKDNNEIPSGKDRDKDLESSLPSGKDLDIPPSRHENGDNDVALTVPSRLMESNPGHSRASNSALIGKVSETDGNLDEMIEEILNETDELENNQEEPHFSNSNNTQKYELGTETHTDVGTPASNTKTLPNSDNNVDMNYQSRTALVSNWLLGQNSSLLPYSLESSENCRFSLGSNFDSSGSNRNFSDNCRGSSGYLASSSGNCEDSSDLPRTIPSDTTPTDTSPSDSSSDDTSANTKDSSGNVTFGCDDFNGEKKPETSSESISKKPIISGTQSEHWTTSSMAISFPTSNALSVNGEVCNHAEELVHSRLSRLKSETSVASLEMTNSEHYSEEEDIVWKKGNMLGKGAFGEVYCGLTDTGQMIAVKQVELITSNMEQAERQYEKLQEEVALLKSLQHKNVVSYLGTCLDGGVVNIFMEFVPGGSIASILARFGALEESVFRLYTKQILVGVEYLHKKNVVHRDIKGGNIMLMPTGVIKLIDFGCAKRLYMNMSQSEGNLLRSMKGTPYWMAPEVIRETGYGRKSDIWSIGCTVFEMATGKPPWSHMTPMSAILAIGQGSEPPKLDKPNSDDACDFVASSMSPDPDERWSAEELLAHPFIRKCDGQR